MQRTTKPFPQHLSPIFFDPTNWVLRETIQTKKTLAKKYAKNNIFCVWHGQFCSKANSVQHSPKLHGGRLKLRMGSKRKGKKNKVDHTKKKKNQNTNKRHICRNCINLWRKWNFHGSPTIRTMRERIKALDLEVDPVSGENSDSDKDYLVEEEEETQPTNLCHNPSYNAEEMRIYLMAEEERKKELKAKQFEKEKQQEEQKRKVENKNQIEQLKKKFHPNEDQIIRQKSLESGEEPLMPRISSELLNPHSNYLVDSEQMIQLLNNVHCPCGRKKILKDLVKGYGSFKAILLCPHCPIKQWEPNEEIFYFSKKLDQSGEEKMAKKKLTPKFKTEIGQRKIIASVLAGNFYENYREQMEMLGLSYLKKNAYYKTIDQLIEETNLLFQQHLKENRSKMDLQNLTICVDAGWSSRRNANECCFIVIDNKTKLLFDLIVVTREIYSGASGNMEAEAARIFCDKHKKKINLVSVVKDGDTKLAKIFEAAWKKVEILPDLNHLLKNLREKILKESSFACLKNIKLSITKWIRSKCKTSLHRLELKIQIQLSIFHFLNSHECCDHVEILKDRYDFPDLNIKDKRFLNEKKMRIQNDIEKYLTILAENINLIKNKFNLKKKMKKEDKVHLKKVLHEIIDKYNYFFEKKINLYHNNIVFIQESEKEEEEKYSLTPQLIELSNLIDELSDRAEEFFKAGSTNKNESFMNSRTKFIEKRINSRKQWEMRCQFSALNRELPQWKTILMDQLGFKINLPQIISQYKKNTEKDYEKIRQNTQEYKTGRFVRKIKKYSNKKRIEEEGHYLFKDDNKNSKTKKKVSCRYDCSNQYKTKLSRLIHEIIFHKRVPVLKEKDILIKDLLLTKKNYTYPNPR
ncbi:hypothetical protein M0813_04132 [Anaeramoeba flamelloides]|uniref:Uncharacterized protein n=1 Tax=Anaeramoeba flamelloides TaxID=1746091 RepID=A0ABQ8XSI0_9EUKA|nr:hypothetical protein M0813_04132 [Anaeramoeba flamelloides]